MKIRDFLIGTALGLTALFLYLTFTANAQEMSLQEILPEDIQGSSIDNDIVEFNYLGDIVTTYDKDEIFSNGYRNGNTYTIFPSTQFVHSGNYWRNFEYATTTLEEWNASKISQEVFFRLPFIKVVNAQTFYSSAGDGVAKCSTPTNWYGCRVMTTADTVSYIGASELVYQRSKNDGTYKLNVGFLPFDISSLNLVDNYVSSSTLYLSMSTITDSNQSYSYFVIASSTQASLSTLVTTDLGKKSYNKLSDLEQDITGIANTTIPFQMNSLGLSHLSSGSGLFSVVPGADISSTTPVYDTLDSINFYASEQTGTTQDPRLVIELTANPEGGGETATTTQAQAGTLPILNDISVITGYVEIYTDSTTTPSETRYLIYHIPFFVWLVFWLVFSLILGRTLIELIIRLRK